MSPRLLMLASLVGGCWPYLPGSFEDYADGDHHDADWLGVRLVGQAVRGEVMGSYFEDDAPWGLAETFWLDAPDPTTSLVDLYDADGQGCGDSAAWLFETGDDSGGPTMTLSGATGRHVLDQDPELSAYYYAPLAAANVPPGSTFDLEAELDGVAVTAFDAVQIPQGFDFEVPAGLLGSEVPTLAPSELRVSWTSTAPSTTHVGLRARLYDADGALIEIASCTATADAGEIDLPDTWNNLSAGLYWTVTVRDVRVVDVDLDGVPDESARIQGAYEYVGAAYVGE